MQEANLNHTVTGCWVEDMAGFGLYANGIGVGDRRCDDFDINLNPFFLLLFFFFFFSSSFFLFLFGWLLPMPPPHCRVVFYIMLLAAR